MHRSDPSRIPPPGPPLAKKKACPRSFHIARFGRESLDGNPYVDTLLGPGCRDDYRNFSSTEHDSMNSLGPPLFLPHAARGRPHPFIPANPFISAYGNRRDAPAQTRTRLDPDLGVPALHPPLHEAQCRSRFLFGGRERPDRGGFRIAEKASCGSSVDPLGVGPSLAGQLPRRPKRDRPSCWIAESRLTEERHPQFAIGDGGKARVLLSGRRTPDRMAKSQSGWPVATILM
jgi:hypothetical protein